MQLRSTIDFHGSRKFILLVVCVLALTMSALAQENYRVAGTVRDQLGGPIVNATVSLMTSQRVVVVTATTDSAGRFALASVSAGDYLVRVGSSGFAQRELLLTVQQNTGEFEIALSIQPVMEEVTVTADPGQVEDASSTESAGERHFAEPDSGAGPRGDRSSGKRRSGCGAAKDQSDNRRHLRPGTHG